jgi:type II secretory pathway pseudopilin PulG
MRRASGFSLIELVIIIIVIGIVAAGMARIFSNTAQSQNTNETLQQATQFAQECAERAVATRQNLGFNGFPANFSCSNPAGFNRAVVVGNIYAGANGTPCPAGVNCRNITITVSSVANPGLSSPITIMLADY